MAPGHSMQIYSVLRMKKMNKSQKDEKKQNEENKNKIEFNVPQEKEKRQWSWKLTIVLGIFGFILLYIFFSIIFPM